MKTTILSLLAATVLATASCKGKNTADESTGTTTVTTPGNTAAPVDVATDNELEQGVRDATKDYPDVQASVDDGVVTLRGTVSRDRLPALMQSIQSLHPKKVNNQLTVQP